MTAKKLASLDALRGVAILLVIASHFGVLGNSEFVGLMLANAGVILFFFLSGFLMDYTLSRDGNPASFVVRRAFRILPVYWLSIALVIAFGAAWTPADLLSNATFTAPIFGQERMLGVYWTLYVEVLFYLAAPFLKLAGDRAIRYSTYAVLSAFVVLAAIHGIGKGAPFYVIFCLCGMQIGSWYRNASDEMAVWASIAATSVGATLLLPVSTFLGIAPILCAAALFFCLRHDLRFWHLEMIGRVSYSWYLLHSIFGYKFSMPVGIAVTFAASVLTYYLLERPMMSAGKAILARVANSAAPSNGRLENRI